MLIDAREIPRDTTLEADLCVIGAGAAGITLARELAGAGLDIVVLESGGLEATGDTQALYQGTLTGESFGVEDLESTRLRFFGGTTNHWSGQCRPFDVVDFERRPGRTTTGWPFGRETLDPYYLRAAEVLQLGHDDFSWQALSDEHGVPPAVLDDDEVRTNLFIFSPVLFGQVYRQELEDSRDLRVYLWANVVDLPLRPDTDAVDRVEVQTLEGNRFSVAAREYVLATGGIENARTLLAARGDRPAGLGNEHDLVGRYFSEHLQAVTGFVLFDLAADQLAVYDPAVYPDPASPRGEFAAAGSLSLTDEAMRTHDLLGLDLYLHGVPEPEMRPTQDGGADSQDVGVLVAAVDGAAPRSISVVRAAAEQSLHADSRVRLTDELDPLGIPRVELHWQVSDDDRRSLLAGVELIGRHLGAAGVGRLQLAPGAVAPDREAPDDQPYAMRITWSDLDAAGFEVGVGSHHLCTTRMAGSPTEGVVDANCRVHSVANLYVAGSSVFGNGSAATPTFTIVALALRLADHLRAVLG